MGELHLDILVDRMRREFKVEANIGKPQVAYRETIRKTVEVEGKYVKQTGGRGQFGHVWVRLEPIEEGGLNYEFKQEISGGSVPKEYFNAVDKGVQQQLQLGVLAGYPVVNVKATLFDGSYHDVDSNENAFRMAGMMAVRKGTLEASPVVLEPIMKVEVTTPADYLGDVMGDLNRRRGVVQGMEESHSGNVIKAEVPLSEMFGYATSVRSLSQGRASFSMEFLKYMEAPSNIIEGLIKKS